METDGRGAIETERLARRFVLWRTLPAVMGLLLVFLGALALVAWSTRSVDRIAVEREMRLFESSLRGLRERTALDQESVTVWDDAVRYLSVDSAEARTWIVVNLLQWMADYFGHDEIYILDADNTPRFGFADGKEGVPGHYIEARGDIERLAGQLRARLHDGDTTEVSKRMLTIGESDVVQVNGHPALLSVKPIVPSDDSVVSPAAPSPGRNDLHVVLIYLDGALLKRLESEHGFRDLHFAARPPALRGTEASYELRDGNGIQIGAFIWSAFHPGDDVLARMTSVLAGVFLVMLAGVGVGLFVLYRRVRGEQVARQELHRLAFYDGVTGLPNRAMLYRQLTEEMATLPAGGPIGVLYVDLERFKLVNETLGREGGNAILAAFALRMAERLRPGERVYRVGGDEFILLTRSRSEAEMRALADCLLTGARVPFVIEGNPVLVGLFAGGYLVSEPGLTAEECVRRADVARFHARFHGRARWAMFGPDMDRFLKQRRETERDLHRALGGETDEIRVFFQPVFSLVDGQVIGAEALARWHHPARGWIAPDVFIPIAEEAELIGQLGSRVLRLACREAARWPGQSIAVNASPRELSDPDYPQRVAEALAASGLSPARLAIEVTESTMLEAAGQTERTLAALRGLGVGIVIDDFGTGFSSLSRLRQLDVDRIKIDRSFITHICESATDQAIVQAIVDMAKAASLATTVEGVETADQGDLLRRIGCDSVQGFFFARPMPGPDVEVLMGCAPPLPPDVRPAEGERA